MTWPVVSLGEVCTVVAGGTPSRANPAYFDGDIPWVKIGDMLQGIVTSTDETITDAAVKSSAAKVLPAGTVLISIFATIGRTATLGVDAATNQAIAGVIPRDPSTLSPAFLRRYLDSIAAELTRKAQGVAQVNINSTVLRQLQIPLPPAGAQWRIVEMLGQADALCSMRRDAISRLDELAHSTFLDMFADTEAWPRLTVADLAKNERGSIRTGPFGSQLLREELVSEGIPVLGIDNVVTNEFAWDKRRYVTPEKYRQLQRYTVRPGDVLISIMGTCGRCAVVPTDIPLAISTKHLCCITLDPGKCLPDFLHAYFLQHPSAKSYLTRTAKGAIMAGLNMQIIKDLPVALPPLIHQEKFVEKLNAINSAKSAHVRQIGKLVELFDSLQYRAFRGGL
ncbi:restriction endonuclease subunit S [Micromonospora sp. NPDC005710]|uniref:restriction endonuclease subunit S n=1 Tax=Micromonospora sp. NPDC005710 TaxID=3157051 RepID=UPI0033F744E6